MPSSDLMLPAEYSGKFEGQLSCMQLELLGLAVAAASVLFTCAIGLYWRQRTASKQLQASIPSMHASKTLLDWHEHWHEHSCSAHV